MNKNKKGVLGLDTVKSVILSLLTLAVVFIAVLLALTTLQNAGIFSTSTASGNSSVIAINNVVGNISSGGSLFFSYVPTFMILLAVVVIILVIAIVIVAVTRFGGTTPGM